jgi:Xaa-Pro dipeptidase
MGETLARVRKSMAENGIDVLLGSSPENVAYLAGISPPSQRTVRSRHSFAVVPVEGETHQVVIRLEAGVVEKRTTVDQLRIYDEFVEDPVLVAAELVEQVAEKGARVGVETTHLPARDLGRLEEALSDYTFTAVDGALSEIRMLKTAEEIDTIRRIGTVAESAARTAVAEARAGTTEREIGNRITELYSAGGGDQLTMLVVGTGERSAEPNAPPTARTVESGDLIRLDVIGTMNNYYSDVARTAIAGEPTDEQQKIWDLLVDIRDRAIDLVRPGVLSSDVYRLYAELMDEAGLPKYHFLGHGLGITLHEEPFLSAIHDVRLEENMVMCIEPLCLISGRFGLQVEDEVVISADGCEPITDGREMLRVGGA